MTMKDADSPGTKDVDWSLTTWEGSRREQLRRWADLPLERAIMALEEMEALFRSMQPATPGKRGVGGETSSGYGRLVPAGEVATEVASAVGAARARPEASKPRHRRGERIQVTRVDDPTGRGKVKLQADDGFIGHFAGQDPPTIGVGQTVEVWVANVGPQGYTLTLRQPKGRRR
jgi:hypothetical protein